MTTNQNQYHYLFKVVLVGNSCVGKSSIVVRYADDEYSEVFLATIGVDFRFKSFPLEGNKIKLQIWDTAGHQRFRTITSSYYRGAHALMIVFDITDKSSFDDAISYWFNEIRSACPAATQVLLVGNKCDLQQKRAVSQSDINHILQIHPEIKYIQTSAKTSQHIEQAFHTISGMLVSQQIKKNQLKEGKQKRQKHTSKSKQSQAKRTQQPMAVSQSNPNNLSAKLSSNQSKGLGQYKKNCCYA